MEVIYIIGDKISFRYNQRYVVCIVVSIELNCIVGELITDYIGKNEEWFCGEKKKFQKSIMKKVKIITPITYNKHNP